MKASDRDIGGISIFTGDTHRGEHTFDRTDVLEGIAPEDEAEVAERVNEILGRPGGNGASRQEPCG